MKRGPDRENFVLCESFSFHQISVVQAKEAEIPNCRNEDWTEDEENFRKRKFGFSKHCEGWGKE